MAIAQSGQAGGIQPGVSALQTTIGYSQPTTLGDAIALGPSAGTDIAFNADGSVVEVTGNLTTTTTFAADGTITETYSGSINQVWQTTITGSNISRVRIS